MKLKPYKIAAMALAGLMFCSTLTFAQQTPAAPSAPTVALPPTPALNGQLQTMTFIAPQAMTDLNGLEFSSAFQTDTITRNKMRKLQAQMRDLQKQMRVLELEGQKKNNEARVERIKVYGQQMTERFKLMDKRFETNFKNFNSRMAVNYDSVDNQLEKKVQSGEVKSKTKTFSKSYPVDANDKLQIENTYGKVTVNTWTKNEFKVDVQIKAYADADGDAQALLDEATIADSKANDLVAFKTTITDTDNGGRHFWGTWTNNGKTSVRKLVINYTVYMPVKSALSISNRYGLTTLPNFDGKLDIHNSWGSLVAKTLTNAGNVISLRYVNANIVSLAGCDLDMAYGDLVIDNADKLNAQLRYSGAKFGKLSTSGNISVHYGDGVQIVDLDKNLKSLSVNSSYAPIKLNTPAATNADFDVTVHLGNFLYEDNAVSVTTKAPDTETRGSQSTKNYKGHIGKGNPDKVIVIKSNMASVKFD